MKVWLITADGTRHPVEPAGVYAIVQTACPACGHEPLMVRGYNRRPSADDRAHEADARCEQCGGGVGIIRAEAETIFGVREDEAVLTHGRARVYG